MFLRNLVFGNDEDDENIQEEREHNRNIANINGTDQIDEIEMTNADPNVFVTDLFKAYPVSLKNHNKVVLPQSMLKELIEKKIWDNRQKDKPLVFELLVADPETADVLEETHVGVDSFTAPPGKIGIPYKTALCLTKEKGVGWLHENPLVSIRLVEVAESKESSMKVQPRGKGFFLEDESVVQLDIRTVLEKTLTDHLVLTKGDWIPLFWDGNRFELVVKDLQPGQIIDVLNTDLTVEMLPSEETEQTLKEKEKAQARVKAFMDFREKRNEDLVKRYDGFKEAEKKAEDTVSFRIRLPKGGQLTKTLNNTEPLSTLIDLVDLALYKKKFVPMHLPPDGLNFYFNLVHVLPGKGKTTLDTNQSAMMSIKEVLKENEITSKMIVLSLQMIEDSDDDDNDEKASKMVYINNEWLKMANRLEACLQENEEEVEIMDQEEIDEIKGKLVAFGVEEELSSKVARLYGKQVNELISMGYGERLQQAAELLNTKRGDLESVINTLLSG